MIMAKDSNNNYVKIEDIEVKNNNEYQDIEKIISKQGNLLYNKYREIENIPPIIFKGKDKNLKNYRIYGNTVDGESVGDRTGNLFDGNFLQGYWAYADGVWAQADTWITTEKIPCKSSTTYTFSFRRTSRWYGFVWFDFNDNYISTDNQQNYSNTQYHSYSAVSPSNAAYMIINIAGYPDRADTISPNDITDFMLVEGSTPLPYEPYGYKVPVTVEGKNLFDLNTWANTIRSISGDGLISISGSTVSITSVNDTDCYTEPYANSQTGVYKIPVKPNTIYTVNWYGSNYRIIIFENGSLKYIYNFFSDKPQSFTTHSDTTFLTLRFGVQPTKPVGTTATISDFMLVEGSTPLPYEPYGYKVPVTVNNGTDTQTIPIYLPEQIRKVGDEAEYIDYGEQKQHRVRVNLSEVNEFSNSITDTSNKLQIWIQQGKNDSFVYPSPSKIFVITEPTAITTSITITNDNDSIRIKHNGSKSDIIIDIVRGLPPGAYSVSFNVLNYDPTTVGGLVINNIMVNKGSTALPYEPYIENTDLDVTLPALPTLPETNVLSVGTAVQPSKVYLKGKLKGKIYGWHVDPDISDSSNAVTYLKDAIGMTPASMGSSTFDYGSWENAFFMPKPCMLKSNGKVDYYLDPNDYTKKLDGTASDISNPNYDGNAMMQWPKIWFKYVKGVKEGQGYFYVANYKADGNYHCWCNYDSEDNEIDHFYTAIYNGTSFMNYSASKTYVVNDFVVYDNKLYKCNTNISTVQAFDSTKWDIVSNTAPAINKMRSLSGIRLTNNNGNAQTNTTTEVTRAEANNTTAAKEWYIETFSDKLLINGLLVLMGKSLNTQAIFGRGLDSGSQSTKEAYITGTLNDKGLFYGVTGDGNSAVKVFGMENFWGCVWHRTAGLITNNHAIKLKLTYGTKDGSTVVGYNQTGNGYIDNGISLYTNGFVQKMSYNKYGFIPAVVTGGSQSTYYADYHYQNENYTGVIYALFGGHSGNGLYAGAFFLNLSAAPGYVGWYFAASLSCKPLL